MFQLWRIVFAAAFVTAAASPCAADDAAPCDLQAMRAYPVTDVLADRALPLAMPDVFFPDPNDKTASRGALGLDEAGAEKRRAALKRGLATFQPEERPFLMLAAISRWIDGDHGLLNFFVLDDGVFLDETLETLDSQGLSALAQLFREGRALFAPDYGTPRRRYERWSDGYGKIRDPVLNSALMSLSNRYLEMQTPLRVAAERVAASPDLMKIYEPLRRGQPAAKKLDYLIFRLRSCVQPLDEPDDVIARLNALPDAQADIAVVSAFESEMLNGSVAQFFFNSPGAFAPEVVAAFTAMGLKKDAAAVQQGINMFPSPYPRDLGARRAYFARGGQGFSDKLEALTGLVDDGSIRPAMLKEAHDADILPR